VPPEGQPIKNVGQFERFEEYWIYFQSWLPMSGELVVSAALADRQPIKMSETPKLIGSLIGTSML
jgi:hypothetical protein